MWKGCLEGFSAAVGNRRSVIDMLFERLARLSLGLIRATSLGVDAQMPPPGKADPADCLLLRTVRTRRASQPTDRRRLCVSWERLDCGLPPRSRNPSPKSIDGGSEMFLALSLAKAQRCVIAGPRDVHDGVHGTIMVPSKLPYGLYEAYLGASNFAAHFATCASPGRAIERR